MKCPKVPGSWIGLCACVLLALGQSARVDTWTRAETRHFVVYSNINYSLRSKSSLACDPTSIPTSSPVTGITFIAVAISWDVSLQ